MWTPDVTKGAPTSVTAFMAVASKAASFGAFLRVFVEGRRGKRRLVGPLHDYLSGHPGPGESRRDRANQHQAHARLFEYRPCRLCADRRRGRRGHRGDGTVGGFASVLLYIAIYSFMTLGALR